ncbi:MAG: hypothetical protein ACK5G7_06780 [Erysipelotrichaceae bacterium]
MIENYNDLLSILILIAIPLTVVIVFLKNIVKKRFDYAFDDEQPHIEYYKEW